eukprot:CAMPEP_0114510088 /NCGR_PEP_ID=MMETSP0109-20121206/13586_1 /TAXON_ID=29199 /ORGANISM="Chlorarachnion reptans, Strain CCCM449" /LENGTH=569 /DNA_ID=CAMNT_0001689343 /DNA_START=110 /DNA_END=1819 /DNA_ORIENTATION=+
MMHRASSCPFLLAVLAVAALCATLNALVDHTQRARPYLAASYGLKQLSPSSRLQLTRPAGMTRSLPSCLRGLNSAERRRSRSRVAELQGNMELLMHTAQNQVPVFQATPKCPVTGIPLPGNVHVVGLSHNTADVSVREKLAIPEAEWKAQAARLNEMPGIDEAGILSTCNRFEVYYVSHDTDNANEQLLRFLESKSGLSSNDLMPNLFFHDGYEAIKHLLSVSSGLDSLVVGEGQILSQVKNCAAHGQDQEGSFGKVLGKLFNIAVATGKRVRTETGISKGAVSVSSAAAQLSEMKVEGDLGIKFEDARIAIVGAGEMTRLLVTHLASTRAKQPLHIINRGRERMEKLNDMFPDVDMSLHTLDEMWDQIKEADIVFTSTFSKDPLLDKANLEANPRDKKLMLVDISVPVNVGYDAKDVEGVTAYHVDDLKEVVEKNKEKRMAAVREAEVMIENEIKEFEGWKQSLRCIPAIKMLREKGEVIRQKELQNAEKILSGLSQKEKDTVDRVTKGIINKLLHGPMAHLRDPEEVSDRVEYKLETVQKMFQLTDLEAHILLGDGKKKKKKKKQAA